MLNLIYSILPTITFIVGFVFGFKVHKKDKLPEIKSPMTVVKEKKKEKEIEKEANTLNDYIENIDNYPHNQKDIKE